METLQKLNSVLQTLVDNRFKKHITLQMLFEMHKEMGVEFGEVTSILNKLKSDGYVDMVETKIPDTESYSRYYSVNFEGLVFNEQGGYVGRFNAENRQSSLNNKVYYTTLVIAFGTFVAAVYYGIEILHFFCHHKNK